MRYFMKLRLTLNETSLASNVQFISYTTVFSMQWILCQHASGKIHRYLMSKSGPHCFRLSRIKIIPFQNLRNWLVCILFI